MPNSLKDAVAAAVSEYIQSYELAEAERLGTFTHELRNRLMAAQLAYDTLSRARDLGRSGMVLGRNLKAMREMIEANCAKARADSGVWKFEKTSVAALLDELESEGSLEANSRGLSFTVTPYAYDTWMDVDRILLANALSNLLKNAFKFTKPQSCVGLSAQFAPPHVVFEVSDECGGLPKEAIEAMFKPFVQRSTNRSGLGLGLVISKKAVEANRGQLRVRDVPGTGCVFAVEVPVLGG